MSSVQAAELPEVPPELVEAGAKGHLVVFVGAGASKGSGLPDWEGLLIRLVERAKKEALTPEEEADLQEVEGWCTKGELLEAASFLRQRKGANWAAGAIASEFQAASGTPTDVHKALAELTGTGFITTNYDSLLESALEDHRGSQPKVVLLSDLEGIKNFSVGQVFKLHGDLERPETIVLAIEDYFRMIQTAARAWKERVKSLLQGDYRLLLVGYSYNDIDVQEVINELRGAYERKIMGPFWLTRRDLKASTRANAHELRPIWLQDYSQVAPWLRKLAQAIEAKKAQAPAVVRAAAYEGVLLGNFKREHEHAIQLFNEQKFEEARRAFQDISEQVASLVGISPEDNRDNALRRMGASSRLNSACCLLCLQQGTEALTLLHQSAEHDLTYLSPDSRAVLAEALGQLGDIVRARAVLAECADTERVQQARVLLEVLEGKLPEQPWPESLSLGFHIVRLLASQGRLDDARREALRLLGAGTAGALGTLLLLDELARLLRHSVWEEPHATQLIPLSERLAVVETLETGISELESRSLPSELRNRLEELKLFYYGLTRDEERCEAAQREVPRPDPLGHAYELASQGRLEEALQLVPPMEHPWSESIVKIQMAATANRRVQALEEVLELVRRWPGRAPIEYETASLLKQAARPEEALPHARAAFEALPGRGFRLLLGECLLLVGSYSEAKEHLDRLRDSRWPRVLYARALTAEQSEPAQAVELWRLYLRSKPEDLRPLLRIPHLLFELARYDEAAEAAWHAFEQGRERYGPGDLFQLAQYQRFGRRFDEEVRSRIRTVVRVLETRFANNVEAGSYRLQLLAALGNLDEVQPAELEGLARAGVVRLLPIEGLKEQMASTREFQQGAHELYRLGRLSFESLCRLTESHAAARVVEFSHAATGQDGFTPLSAPVALEDEPPIPGVQGQRILAGPLELLLLQRLGLMGRLREALGEKGRLLLFEDAWERVVEDAANLEQRTQRVAWERHERLFKILVGSSKTTLENAAALEADEFWAQRQAVPLIHPEPVASMLRVSPRALAAHLLERGAIDRPHHDKLMRALSAEEGPLPALGALPERVAITYGPLMAFFECGVLEELLEALPGRLIIGPGTLAALKRRRDELARANEAAELAAALHRVLAAGRAEGWVETCRRPWVQLPELASHQLVEFSQVLLHDPMAEALSYREALVEDTSMLLLSADSFIGTQMIDHREAILSLAWPSRSAMEEFLSRMDSTNHRILHVPMLIRMLLREREAEEVLLELVGLGFADALDSALILNLVRRYGPSGGGSGNNREPDKFGRILDRTEWIARQREHICSELTGMRVARVYSQAIWDAFLNFSVVQAQALANTLLARAERLVAGRSSGLLRLLLRLLLDEVSDGWRHAFIEEPEHERMTLSLETRSGNLLLYLADWAGSAGLRSACHAYALRGAWLDLDSLELSEDEVRLRSAALFRTLMTRSKWSPMAPGFEALAILSVNWSIKPLAEMTGKTLSEEERLRHFAEQLAANPPRAWSEASMIFEADGQPYVVAPEAILLRVNDPEVFKEWARRLAERQGPHDGRAYDRLIRLSENMHDQRLRREYARMAAVAPWRLVRQDPTLITAWAWDLRLGMAIFPSDIDGLLQLLSEPEELLPGEHKPWHVLQVRLEEGGFWSGRSDRGQLYRQASEVPGHLPALVCHNYLSQDKDTYSRLVEQSLWRLAHPEEQPAAHLVADIYFLRLGAARRPYVRLADGERDLRQLLPERFHQALWSIAEEQSAPQESSSRAGIDSLTIAACEAALLRLCGKIVSELDQPPVLAFKDGLWLTYRLFQWLWAQLTALSPDARLAGLAALQKLSPPARDLSPAESDLLNPFGFGPQRFDHRLAAVLYAFSSMEELQRTAPAGREEIKGPPSSVTSAKLEELLVKIASRPLSERERALREREWSPSCLDWAGPGAVADLALKALLEINDEALLRMPVEQRLRWLRELPRLPKDPGRLDWKLGGMLREAFALHSRRLSAEERRTLEEHLRELEGNAPEAKAMRWRGFTYLYGAGLHHLQEEVLELLLGNLGEAQAAKLFGVYLVGLSRTAPERLESEVERVMEKVVQAGLEPVPFAEGVGRVIILGEGEGVSKAAAILRQLAERPPFKGHERMKWLLGVLGIR